MKVCLASSNSEVGVPIGLGVGIPLGVLLLTGVGFLIYSMTLPPPPKEMTAAERWRQQLEADRRSLPYYVPAEYQMSQPTVPKPYVNTG